MKNLHIVRNIQFATIAIGIALLVANVGCIQLAANLMHVWNGSEIPPEFDGLKGKRVAIVAVTESGVGTDPNAVILTNLFRGLLDKNVKKIKLVTQSEVDQWFDGEQHGTEQNLVAMGKGVDADMVVVIGMNNLKLKEGQTLFRGKSDLSVSVYDMSKEGKVVYRRKHAEFAYPEMGGMPTTESDETKFRRIYLLQVADKLGHHFYGQDLGSGFADDATILGY